MDINQLKPGDRVFVLDEYANQFRQKIVKRVAPQGVWLKGTCWPTNFGQVYGTRDAVVAAMHARAEERVLVADRAMLQTRAQLRRLRKKYPMTVGAED